MAQPIFSTRLLLILLLPITTLACGSFHMIGDPYTVYERDELRELNVNTTAHRVSHAITCSNGSPLDNTSTVPDCTSPNCWLSPDYGHYGMHGTINISSVSLDAQMAVFDTIRKSEQLEPEANNFQFTVIANLPESQGYCIKNEASAYMVFYPALYCYDGLVESCDDEDKPLASGMAVQVCTPLWDKTTTLFNGTYDVVNISAAQASALSGAAPNWTSRASGMAGDMLGMSERGGSWMFALWAVLLASFAFL